MYQLYIKVNRDYEYSTISRKGGPSGLPPASLELAALISWILGANFNAKKTWNTHVIYQELDIYRTPSCKPPAPGGLAGMYAKVVGVAYTKGLAFQYSVY